MHTRQEDDDERTERVDGEGGEVVVREQEVARERC